MIIRGSPWGNGTGFCFAKRSTYPRRSRENAVSCAEAGKNAHLSFLAQRIHSAFIEVCIENQGRPAAVALSDFVAASLRCMNDGISFDVLMLELEMGSEEWDVAGYRLTQSDRNYRRQWILAVCMTFLLFPHIVKHLKVAPNDFREWSERDLALFRIVTITLTHLVTQQTHLQVKFDRSLATRGASGGVACENVVLPAAFIPVTQLVLLTVKHLQEDNDIDN